MLTSEESATRHSNGNARLMSILVFIDLLRVVIQHHILYLEPLQKTQMAKWLNVTKGQQYERDLSHLDDLCRLVRDFETVIDCTATEVKAFYSPGCASYGEIQKIIEVVQADIWLLKQMCQEIRTKAENSFAAFASISAIHEASSVKRLAWLATVFLPLSLCTGILSMQLRLKELGPILWDYGGLAILVSTLTFAFLALLPVLRIVKFYTFGLGIIICVLFLNASLRGNGPEFASAIGVSGFFGLYLLVVCAVAVRIKLRVDSLPVKLGGSTWVLRGGPLDRREPIQC